MKKLILFFLPAIVMISCSNNEGNETTDAMKDSTDAGTKSASVDYPYTIEHPDYWEMGSTDNTMAALSALKAYENGNIDECMKYFGDSVHLQFNGMDAKLVKDSVKSLFAKNRGDLKSLEIKMDDWESVISKDKNAEYVSLWYTEIWEDAKGKKDSLVQMDDLRIKDGKIVGIDQKSRKYPTK